MPGHSCVCRVWVGHRWRPVQAKYVCLAGKQEAGTLEVAAKRQGRHPEGRLGREGGQIWQGLCRVCGGETHWGQSEWDKRGRAQTAGSQQQGRVPARPSHAQGDAGQAEWGAPLGVLWFDWRKPEGGVPSTARSCWTPPLPGLTVGCAGMAGNAQGWLGLATAICLLSAN